MYICFEQTEIRGSAHHHSGPTVQTDGFQMACFSLFFHSVPCFLEIRLYHIISKLTFILFHPHIWVAGSDLEGCYA